MQLQKMTDLDLAGRTVFMRLDLNAPIQDGVVTSDARLSALPSIQYALEQGAQLALASHLGRPKGKYNPDFSLIPVGSCWSELLGVDVHFSDNCTGEGVQGLLKEKRTKGVLLLENLRFHAGETKNDADCRLGIGAAF